MPLLVHWLPDKGKERHTMHYAVCGISGSDKTALLNNLRHLPQMTRLTTWATGEEEAP